MKFTKSLIATSVMAAAATASAKTTMTIDGEAFFKQTTFENEPDANLANIDDDQKVGKGFTLDSVDVSFDSQWDGFSTQLGLDAFSMGVDEAVFAVEYFNATTAVMGGKLELTIGRQADMTGGNIGYGALGDDTLDNSMDGISAKYNLGQGSVTVMTGASAYNLDVELDLDADNINETTLDTRDLSKFMSSPFMGLGYEANYGAIDVLFTYHMRSTGEYKAGGNVILEDIKQTWMALGLGYTMGATTIGFDYLTYGQTAAADGGDDTTVTEMALEAAHNAGMWTRTFTYAATTTKTGDVESTDTRIGLDVDYAVAKEFSWFGSYDSVTTETKDSDPSDKATDTSIMLGARWDATAAL